MQDILVLNVKIRTRHSGSKRNEGVIYLFMYVFTLACIVSILEVVAIRAGSAVGFGTTVARPAKLIASCADALNFIGEVCAIGLAGIR